MKKIRLLANDQVVCPLCELKTMHFEAFMFNYLCLRDGHNCNNDEIFRYTYQCCWNLRMLHSNGFIDEFKVCAKAFSVLMIEIHDRLNCMAECTYDSLVRDFSEYFINTIDQSEGIDKSDDI